MNEYRQIRPFSEVELDNPKQVLDYVLSRWEHRSTSMADQEVQWCENLGMYLGHQWAQFSRRRRRMEDRPLPFGKMRLTINLLLPMVQREVASIIRANPTWKAIPVTNEVDDISKARLSTKFLQYRWREDQMRRKLIELGYWLSTTGNGWLKTYWDKEGGPERVLDREEIMLSDMPLEQMEARLAQWDQMKGIFGVDPTNENQVIAPLGDLKVEVRSPFEVDVDRTVSRYEDVIVLVDTSAVGVRWARETYDDKKIQSDTNEATLLSRHYIDRVASYSESPDRLFSSHPEMSDMVLRHEMWVAPTKKYRRGFFAVVLDGKVRESGPSPYKFKGAPYDFFKGIHVPGRLHGTCNLRHTIPPQVDLNRTRTMLSEEATKWGRPKPLIPEGNNIRDADLRDPSKSIKYDPTFGPPSFMERPQIPEWVSRLGDYQKVSIQDISSQHEASQGLQPGSVRTGRGISELREADAAAQIPSMNLIVEGLNSVGSKMLAIASEFYNERRLIQNFGADEEIDAFFFTGGELLGDKQFEPGANYFNVVTEIVASQPLTAAGKEARVWEMVDRGILDPLRDRDKIFQMLELGVIEPLIDERRFERQNIERENVMMMRGEQVFPQPYDNTIEHIQGHRRFQKRPEYRNSPPQVQQLFEQHIQQEVMKLQQEFMQRSQIVGGAGGQQPQPAQEQPAGGGGLEAMVAQRRAAALQAQ